MARQRLILRWGVLLSFLSTIFYLCLFSGKNPLLFSVVVVEKSASNPLLAVQANHDRDHEHAHSDSRIEHHDCVVGLGYPHSGIADIVQALNNVATVNRTPAAQWNATENQLFENFDSLQQLQHQLLQHQQGNTMFVYSQSLDSASCTHVKLFIVRRDMFEVLANVAETLSISERQKCPIRTDAVVQGVAPPDELFQSQFQLLLQSKDNNNERSCLMRLAKHYLAYDRQLQTLEAANLFNNNNNNENNNNQVTRISHRDFVRVPNETLQSLCARTSSDGGWDLCRQSLDSDSNLNSKLKRQRPVKSKRKKSWSPQTMSQLQKLVHVNNEACSSSPAGWTPSGPFTVYSAAAAAAARRNRNNKDDDHPTTTTTGVVVVDDTNKNNNINDLSNFLMGPGLEQRQQQHSSSATATTRDDPPAMCVFTGGQFHFPHAMEQLYACFSWWQANPEQKSVLVYNSTRAFPSGYKKKGLRHRDSFVRGFLANLEQVFGVEIVSTITDTGTDTGTNTDTGSHAGFVYRGDKSVLSKYGPFSIRGFQMRGPQDALTLSLGVLQHNNRESTVQAATARKKSLVPRVAILNRGYRHDKPSRSLLNADQVIKALRRASRDETLYSVAPVAYFESASFLDQVDFYSSVDIVISPHGAQLTGIAFMPSCGSVLELFPKGYSIPEYFGSLAISSGLFHSYFYMSQGNETEENAIFMMGAENREASRCVDFCGTPSRIVDAVRQLVEEWKQCQV